jgi:hypothetical protein
MKRTLSHPMTPLMKFILPLFWIAGFGYGTLMLWLHPRTVEFNGVRGGAPSGFPWLFLLAFAGGTFALISFALPLKRVVLTEQGLYVSNYRTEIVIPFNIIEAVRQRRLFGGGIIQLDLRRDLGLGTVVKFMPPARRLAFWKEDEIVAELRERAGLPAN